MHWLLSLVSCIVSLIFLRKMIRTCKRQFTFVFLPHIAHHAQDVPEEVVQSSVRRGEEEFWKHKRASLSTFNSQIGRHFLYCDPIQLTMQLKMHYHSWKSSYFCGKKKIHGRFFRNSVFFFRKQDWQTFKAIKPKGQILMRVIFCPQ